MKTVYNLTIKEKDDYIYSHNTLVCQKIEFDDTKKRIKEFITLIDGIETQNTKYTEYLIKDKWVRLEFSDAIFETRKELKTYLQDNYLLVHSTKYDFYFLDKDEYNTVFTITNYSQTGLGCSNDFVNLQDLLKLNHKE